MIHPRLIIDSLTSEEIREWLNYHEEGQRIKARNKLSTACTSIEGILRQTLRIIESSQELRNDEEIQSRKENIRLIRRRVRSIREGQPTSTRRYSQAQQMVSELFNNNEIQILIQSQELVDEMRQRIED